MRLITIPISHYCERARWALDHAGVAYVEEHHLQMFHRRHVARYGGKTVPVLLTDEGEAFTDSAHIMSYADHLSPEERKLYPSGGSAREEIVALEREYAETFGVESRRVMYYHFFQWGRAALRFNGGSAPWFERWALYAGYPMFFRFARRYLNVSRKTMEGALDVVRRTFDAVADRLADGRQFLTGDRFTAADLTFACMAATVTAPPNYGVPLPSPDEVPDEPGELFCRFRSHEAGAFALRMFADHRWVFHAAPDRPPSKDGLCWLT